MAEAVSQADISWNDELWIGRTSGSTTTWTQIMGVEEIAMPERVPEDVDVTHQQSPGRSRETIPGLLPVAELSQSLQLWAEHASQTMLQTLADLTAAGTPEDVSVEMNIGGIRRTYRGHIKAFTPTGTVGEKRMATLAASLFNVIAPNPRALSGG